MKRIITLGFTLAALIAFPGSAAAQPELVPACYGGITTALNAPKHERPGFHGGYFFSKQFQCLTGQPPNAGPGHP
jgi:hypothetical protein